MQYLAYSQPPTSVAEAHKADFLEPGVDSVVQIKHSVIELHVLVASGLRLALSGTIQGVVLKAIPVRLRSHRTSGLAVLTTTYQLFVIVFDKASSQIKTLASHSVYERGAVRSVDLVALLAGSSGEASAPTPFLALHAFQGLVRIITLDSGDGAPQEGDSKRATGGSELSEPLDLSRGFVTRIPELLLNAMCLLPTPTGHPPRLATIHSNRHGQRVFHTHAVNFNAKSIDTYEPGAFDSPVSAFLSSAGITLFDADSQLMIPVRATIAEGVIVIGSESGLFFSTASQSKSHGKRKSVSSAPGAALQDTAMEVDEVPEMQSSSSKGKGKGRSDSNASLTMSPAKEAAALPPTSRRRSSASSSQAPLATSPTSPMNMDSRAGSKRKLSDAANSSGRGKGPTRTRSGSTVANLPVECKLPISEYVAHCTLSESDNTWILADSWGQAMYLRLIPSTTAGDSASAGPSSSAATASPPLATSPTNGSQLQGRRPSRTASGRMKDSLPVQLVVEPISKGRFSSPTALLDLGGGYIYVGSHYGDSLLTRLTNVPRTQATFPSTPRTSVMEIDDAPTESASAIEIVNTYTNLAPIVDFCVVETESGQGPSHLVACSGGKNDGTLRIVRHGVSISELASLEIEGAQKAFFLQARTESTQQDILVLSFISDTRVLTLNQEEEGGIDELDEFGSFDLSQPTIHACSYESIAYQVTSAGVTGGSSSWQAPSGKKITLASSHEQYILLAISGGELYLLDLSQGLTSIEVAHSQLGQEAACLDLSKVKLGGTLSLVAAVGLWNSYSVVLLDVPALRQMDNIDIGTTFLLRSVVSASLGNELSESAAYLLVGLGDGSLVSYTYRREGSESKVIDRSSRKSVALGTRPITLAKFYTAGNSEAGVTSIPAVLAISDRSTVVSAPHNKLIYSSVNTKNIGAATALSTASFPDSLLTLTSEALTIGRVEQLEKLDVQTLRLGEEAPRRVAYSSELRAYGVGFLRESLDRTTGEITRTSTFKMLAEDGFQVLLDFPMRENEEIRSVACLSLLANGVGPEYQQYFAVGTAIIEPDQEESTMGRVLLLGMSTGNGLWLMDDTQTKGAVHSIGQLPNGRFVASSNSEVIAFYWCDRAMKHLFSWGATFIAYSLAIKDNYICVVDPLRSASLLRWDEKDNRIYDIGREYSAYGLFAAAFLPDVEVVKHGKLLHSIIAADLDLNLFTAKNFPISINDNTMGMVQEIFTLKVQGMIHTGDVINKFAQGSLVPAYSRSSDGPTPQVMFATSVGSIGMVASIPQSASTILSAVERNLRKVLQNSEGNFNIGGLPQEEFRSFKAEYRTQPAVGFIDGTLLETLLALDDEGIEKVLQGTTDYEKITASKEEVVRMVEELQRMH